MPDHALNLDAPPAPPTPRRVGVRPLATGLAGAAALILVWSGGWLGLTGLVLAAVGMRWLLRPSAQALPAAPATPAPPHVEAPAGAVQGAGTPAAAPAVGRHGAEVMVRQVVPVWSRQLDLTREAATEGIGGILNSFSAISGALHELTQKLQTQTIAAEPGSVAATVNRETAALEPLLAASQRAFAQRDEAFAVVAHCAESVAVLRQHTKTARELARHTRLVAFNASIESQRRDGAASHDRDGGLQAVASEVRMLATRIGEAAERIDQVVTAMEGPLSQAQCRSTTSDTTEDELRMEVDLAARQALHALIASLGAALAGSDEVAQTVATLRNELDESFVHFQFGDRVSQMLAIVASDMGNFTQWVAANPTATQSDAARWLEALESAYTMEEQRSGHHGNVHVHQSAGVEFF